MTVIERRPGSPARAAPPFWATAKPRESVGLIQAPKRRSDILQLGDDGLLNTGQSRDQADHHDRQDNDEFC